MEQKYPPTPIIVIRGDKVLVNKMRRAGTSSLCSYFPLVLLDPADRKNYAGNTRDTLGISVKDIEAIDTERQLDNKVRFLAFSESGLQPSDDLEFISVSDLDKEIPLDLIKIVTMIRVVTMTCNITAYSTVPVVIWKRSMILLAITCTENDGVKFSIPGVNVVDGQMVIETVAAEIREIYGIEFDNWDTIGFTNEEIILAVDYKRIDSPCPGDPSYLYKFISARIAYQLLVKEHPVNTPQTPVMKYLEQFL